MKTTLAFFAMLTLTSISVFAADGDCSREQLIQAVQKKCGSQVRYVENTRIGHYQGEVTGSYIITMEDGRTEKNMKLDAEGGNCQDDYIAVDSACP